MATENDDGKEVSPQRSKGGARRWYGAARGMAIAFPIVFLLPGFAFSYLPLGAAVVSALIGWMVPGRPHTVKNAWRTVGESFVWLAAALHLALVALWLYLATGLFGFLIDKNFRSAVKDADRIVIRDGGGLCHSKPDKEPSLFEITNKAEIAAFNDMFKFSGRTMSCKCCGYPGIDWWRDGQCVVVSALHHGHALRISGIGGDLRFTIESRRRVQEWLETHCGLTPGDNSPRYRRCIMARARIESEVLDLAKTNDSKKPTMDDLRDEFKKNGKEFPACPAGGEYSLTYGEDGKPVVKCSAPRHD